MSSEARFAANNFTPLRLLLALMVVVGHSHILAGDTSPPWPFSYARAAVDCFFVVSGYLVTSSFDSDPNLSRFYIHRFFRIYPLYIAVVLCQTLVLAALQPDAGGAEFRALARYFAVNAVFANFLQYDAGNVLAGLSTPGLNPSLWTLKIEFGFYLILPFLWMLTRRLGIGFLVAVFGASALYYNALTWFGHYEFAKQLPGQLQFFAVGMATYMYRSHPWLRMNAVQAIVVALGLALAMTMLKGIRPPVLYPLIVGALVFVTAMRVPPLSLRTDISYGVYLSHGPVIQLALLFGFYRMGWLGLAIVLTVTILLALVAERWIESPGIAFGRYLSSLRKTDDVAPTYVS